MKVWMITWVMFVAIIMTVFGIWTIVVLSQWLIAMLVLISSVSLFVAGVLLTKD